MYRLYQWFDAEDEHPKYQLQADSIVKLVFGSAGILLIFPRCTLLTEVFASAVYTGIGLALSFVIFLKFWAIAARVNSFWAPIGPND